MFANILVYDIGSTYTKVAAFNEKNEVLTYLGRGQSPTTLSNIMDGVRGAESSLSEQGIAISPDTRRYSSCSAAGGLRMVALGYMPRVTVKAAKEVSMTAGARVMQVVSADEPLSFRKEVLREINPDIILLSGGTDGGDEECVLENADMICELKSRATIILGCNRTAQMTVAKKFADAGIQCVRVPNIMPTIHELNVAPARTAIHEQFIKQITKASGLREFQSRLSDRVVVPTPGAVLLASELLASGSYEQEGAGSLILIDIGGATTDVHSAIPELEKLAIEERGLVINNEKQFSYRTVEGNLGLRVSATGIPDAIGAKAVISAMREDFSVTPEEILSYTEMLEQHTNYIASNRREEIIDQALATCAISVALRRHAGYYAQEADPIMGIIPGTPMGRDLRFVNRVLCVGGIFVHAKEDEGIDLVRNCFANPGISLLPVEEPEIMLDRDYIFYALGVLGRHNPDMVLDFMKRHYIKK